MFMNGKCSEKFEEESSKDCVTLDIRYEELKEEKQNIR
jgi:hypothetical protein